MLRALSNWGRFHCITSIILLALFDLIELLINLFNLQELPQLTSLAVADMGTLPVGLLVPFKHLRYLNISGNQLDHMSLQVIDPCRELEVSFLNFAYKVI